MDELSQSVDETTPDHHNDDNRRSTRPRRSRPSTLPPSPPRQGVVKWYNEMKRFGCLVPVGVGPDVGFRFAAVSFKPSSSSVTPSPGMRADFKNLGGTSERPFARAVQILTTPGPSDRGLVLREPTTTRDGEILVLDASTPNPIRFARNTLQPIHRHAIVRGSIVRLRRKGRRATSVVPAKP